MAIKFLSGQTISGTLTVSGNVQGATFNGLAINTTGVNNVANQIVRTEANGYVNFGWINSISGNHTGSITRITASNDAYLRYVTPAQFRTGVTDGFYAPSSTVTGVTSVATGNGLTGGTIISTGTLTMASSYTGGFTFNTSVASPIHSGTVSTSGDGQNNYPFRLGSDYSAYMVAAASNTWGLFWAGNSGARYGTNGNGGPGNIWSNSTNPNEFCFVGGDSTRWSVQGSTGDTWQLGNIYLSGTFVRANNNLTLQVDGGGTPVNAITIDNVGSTTFSGYTYFPNYLFHAGDTNTRIQFSTSTITLRGDSLILLDGPVTANEDVSIGGVINQYGGIFRNASFIDIVGNRNSKIELETAYFTNTVSNQAVNIQFPNVAQQGYYKITLSGSYSHQDISGKLTKVIPFGYNPNGGIWRTGNTQSEITIATGGVSTNFTIGNLAWDSTNSKFIVPIYKLTSTGNSVKILIEYFGGAANNLKDVNLSSNYTQTAPSPFNVRQYQNIRDRLGVGMISPQTKIDVTGSIQLSNQGRFKGWYTAGSGLGVEVGVSGGDGYLLTYNRDTNAYGNTIIEGTGIQFVTHSSGKFYFQGGDVGIGNTSPGAKLDVGNTIHPNTTGIDVTAGTDGGNCIGLTTVNNHNWFPYTDGNNYYSATKHQFRGGTNNGPNYMMLDPTGLGIGTTSPNPFGWGNKHLTVLAAGTNQYAAVDIVGSGNAAGAIIFGGGSGSGTATNIARAQISGLDGSHLVFATNASNSGSSFTERMRITSGGKVKINGSTPPEGNAQLNIGYTGSGETRAIDVHGGWSGNESKSITFTHAASLTSIVGQINVQHNSPGSRIRWGRLFHGGDSSAYTMELISSSTTTANLTVAGNITAQGDVVAYSDERLKSNIKTLDGSKVLKMRGVSFEKEGKKGSGVIAQELEKVAPELVNNDSEYLGVAYGNLTGYLIEAIKEQQKQIDDLKLQVKNMSKDN